VTRYSPYGDVLQGLCTEPVRKPVDRLVRKRQLIAELRTIMDPTTCPHEEWWLKPFQLDSEHIRLTCSVCGSHKIVCQAEDEPGQWVLRSSQTISFQREGETE